MADETNDAGLSNDEAAAFSNLGNQIADYQRNAPGVSSEPVKQQEDGGRAQPGQPNAEGLAKAAELRASAPHPNDKGYDAYMKNLTAWSRYGQGYGPRPGGNTSSDPLMHANPGDILTNDSALAAELAKGHAPIGDHELQAVETRAQVKGLDADSGRFVGALGVAVGLSRSDVDVITERMAAHYGRDHDAPPEGYSQGPLSDAEVKEYAQIVASKWPGGWDQFAADSETVRQYLASVPNEKHGNVLKLLDHYGLTGTSMAFDMQTIRVLLNAANRKGFRR